MNHERLRECLTVLHRSEQALADLLGCPLGISAQWSAGRVQIPDDVAAWLDKLARFHTAPKEK